MHFSTAVQLALGLSFATATVLPGESLVARDTAEDIWEDIEEAVTCDACDAVLLVLQGVAEFGTTAFVDTITEICELSGAEDDDVCAGSIALEGPIIANDLQNFDVGSETSTLFCITFLGLCSYPPVDPYTVSFPTPKPATSRPAPSGQTPIKVVHYSDIHVDPFYVAGSNANCTKPICCRNYDSADAPGNNDDPAGPYGDHNCDAPVSLEESMYAAIKELVPDAAFALFTGDIVDHAVWNTTEAQNILDMNNAYALMASSGAFPVVFGTAGNHESSPTNAYPPADVGDESQWVYDTLAADWAQWIGASAASGVSSTTSGAYSTTYGNNLRIISLNTNFYYVQNYWLYQPTMETDPSGQLAWLVGELQAAETAGQRVYIIGHMPFGLSDTLHNPSNYLDQIVNRYEATIAAMFFGHTHLDHFEISYADYTQRSYQGASAMSYIMPSLTPTSGMPAFRVYTVDPVTFGVLDATTYAADMTNPDFQTTGPVWTEYYSAKAAYGPLVSPPLAATDDTAELTPAFWHNVTEALAASQDAFDAYYARKSRGWDVAACTGTCATAEICQLQSARAEDNCITPTPGISFRKRAEEPAAHRDECGVSVLRSTLSSLVARSDLMDALQGKLAARRAVRV